MSNSKFAQKTGKITIPSASPFIPDKKPLNYDLLSNKDQLKLQQGDFQIIHPYKLCYTNLKEGCYAITISPKNSFPFLLQQKGTIRVDKSGNTLCISGDLYRSKKSIFQHPPLFEKRKPFEYIENIQDFSKADIRNDLLDGIFKRKNIPIFSRRSYYAYLLGTSASLRTITGFNSPCHFSLSFDLYEFDHDADGYEGTFPNTATRTIKLALTHTDEDDYYTGNVYEGDNIVGEVKMEWVSKYFRKAYLDIHTLSGAEAPQSVPNADGTGTESFRTIFATAGWNLITSYKTPDINMPASLVGIQNSNDCWSRENSHELLESVSTYDASILDKKWKVHLLAIEGKLGCSRGRMFDNEISAADIGDVNNVAREGAVTYSHDGYNSASFGDNEDDLQKDTPRAFIRSAAHEVGHAFNMIHQNDEDGNDNSIMTVSPGVASVLNSAGLDFPEDINLSFNAHCRHHLIHRPDPWVRPGALEFTGSLVGTPEADDIYFYPSDILKLDINLSNKNIKLGEILNLSWKVTNVSKNEITMPQRVTNSSFTARISVSYPDGTIRYIRPTDVNADIDNPLSVIKPKESRSAETTMFWNKKGFIFKNPGMHTIDINIIWKENGKYYGISTSEDVWVDYPVTVHENEVASIMLNKEVGRFIATKGRKPIKEAINRIETVISKYKSHPASATLRDIPGHGYSKVKIPAKKKISRSKK